MKRFFRFNASNCFVLWVILTGTWIRYATLEEGKRLTLQDEKPRLYVGECIEYYSRFYRVEVVGIHDSIKAKNRHGGGFSLLNHVSNYREIDCFDLFDQEGDK